MFLTEIGLTIEEADLEEECFVPGLKIHQGKILMDINRMKYPGDLIHEAGHLAVVPEAERASLNGSDIENRPSGDGEEIAALLWSYLACQHLNIPPSFVFHPYGYKGDSEWLVKTFEERNYIGAPLLTWMGIINWDPKENNPLVVHWLRK